MEISRLVVCCHSHPPLVFKGCHIPRTWEGWSLWVTDNSRCPQTPWGPRVLDISFSGITYLIFVAHQKKNWVVI